VTLRRLRRRWLCEVGRVVEAHLGSFQKILWKVFEFHPRQIVVDTSNVDEIAVAEEGEKMKWKYREIKK
jgi:hypothetical protein